MEHKKADRRKNPKKRRGRVLVTIGKVAGTILLIAVIAALIFTCIFAVYIKTDLSKQVDFTIQDFSLNQTSVIYYEDPDTGKWEELQQLFGKENRIWASYDELPSDLIFACVSIEDKRFFEHQGVDWLTTGKACVNMFLGTGSAGGSTITQQLIKNLTGDQEITVRRKIIEIFRALQFEKTHSKEEILEWYLNVIYLGEGCSGVRSASQVYFGKDVSELTLAECAALVGITNNPSVFDPYQNPENNRERQLTILGEMLAQGYISQQQYDDAVAQKMVFTNSSAEGESDSQYYSYFVDQVVRDVIADLADKTGYSEAIAEKMVYCGGYSIYATIEPDVQAAVDAAYENLDNIPNTASSQQLQSAMVVIDNASGDVAAIAGGVGEKAGSLTLSRATQSMLSPGSSIKPITVYSPALDLGLITPASVFDDTPYSFDNGYGWPKNSDNTYRGLTSVNRAVELSLNTVAVKIVSELTPEYSYSFAKDKMGLSTLVADVDIDGKVFTDADLAPMSMGGLTRGVTVRDMATAYAAIADEGYYRKSRTYTKVVDPKGVTVLDNEQEKHQAMKSNAAWYMTYMLENAVKQGTSTPARMDGMAVAAKTGTTTSNHDRWFAGFTPYYTGVVWCGYDDPEEVILTDSSTNPALAMWKKVMTPVHEGLEGKQFEVPEGVVDCSYCRDSGLLATDACRADPRGSRVVSGKLFKTDVPTAKCDVHELVDICGESGHAATEFCAEHGSEITPVGLLNVSRAYPITGVYVQDEAYVSPSALIEIASGYYPPSEPGDMSTVCTLHEAAPLPDPVEESPTEQTAPPETQISEETGEPYVDQ